MNNLIYFSTLAVRKFDLTVLDNSYEFSPWFKLIDALEWPAHTTSRVHRLSTPWDLAPTVCPIPNINHNETDFGRNIESVAEDFCKLARRTNRTPYVAWSGGIDSTSILVSLLKTADSDFLKKLVVLCNANSVKENPYFFYKFIDKKIQTQDVDAFKITEQNYNKILLVDGEGGNQLFGWRAIHTHSYYQNFDFLDQPWKNLADLKQTLPGSSDLNIQLLLESIDYAPIDIDTVHDFVWWGNFNFKFDQVLLRKTFIWTEDLSPAQSQDFYENTVYRFYAQPQMQVWSMITKDLRRESVKLSTKWHPKKYIYDFDHNDLWFASKKEEASMTSLDLNLSKATVVAIDKEWNKYSIAEPTTRKQLGKILKRN